jgi:tRNA pseudouridine55 synthase
MPLRRSVVHALDVIAYTGDVVTLDLRVSSGTYIRAIADAIGGHCRTLRRTEVGPFDVSDAVAPGEFEPRLLIPEADVLAQLDHARVEQTQPERAT